MSELPRTLVGDFIDAVVRDEPRAEALLKEHPALIEARWLHNETVLHFLAVEGWGQAVEFLAKRGADVNAVNRFGDSPLVDVARRGLDYIAGVLLEYGANPNAVSTTADNVLHAAIGSGNPDLVARLLAAGADPHYRADLGESVFDAARGQPHEACEAILAALASNGIVELNGRVDR
jgi:ankyrin repeat protein